MALGCSGGVKRIRLLSKIDSLRQFQATKVRISICVKCRQRSYSSFINVKHSYKIVSMALTFESRHKKSFVVKGHHHLKVVLCCPILVHAWRPEQSWALAISEACVTAMKKIVHWIALVGTVSSTTRVCLHQSTTLSLLIAFTFVNYNRTITIDLLGLSFFFNFVVAASDLFDRRSSCTKSPPAFLCCISRLPTFSTLFGYVTCHWLIQFVSTIHSSRCSLSSVWTLASR
jgi:hypothetical protein